MNYTLIGTIKAAHSLTRIDGNIWAAVAATNTHTTTHMRERISSKHPSERVESLDPQFIVRVSTRN